MYKFMKSFVCVAVLCICAGIIPVFAQKSAVSAGTMKFGVVDTRKILEQMPEVKDAEEKLREVGTKYKDTLETIQKDYMEALQNYDKQKAMMSPEAKTKAEENLQTIQQRYIKYNNEKLNMQNPQSELGKLQEELLDPLRKKVKAAIKDVAKDEKLSGVMEAPAFIYFEENMDITFRVLDKLKRNK